jgi:microcystin-dependent protein
VGTTGGAETHALQASELPSHSHGFTNQPFTTSTVGAHTHGYPIDGDIQGSGAGGGFSVRYHRAEYNDCTDSNSPQWCNGYTHNTYSGGAHSHSGTMSGTTGSVGSGAAHNIMSPFLAIKFIIKT